MNSATLKWSISSLPKSNLATRYIVVIAWCAIIIGVALRFVQLPTRELYFDEAITQMRVAGYKGVDITRQLYDGKQRSALQLRQYLTVRSEASPKSLISSLIDEDAQHPPLFYLLEQWFVRIFGNSLVGWRMLPAMLGVLCIPAAFLLARELFASTTVGLVVAAIFAASPIERIYSEQAREYSLLVLLVLLGTFAVARAMRLQSFTWWALYAFVAAAGLYTSPFMGYTLLAHSIFVLRTGWGSRRLLAFTAALSAALVAFAPWTYELIVHRSVITATNDWSSAAWPFSRLVAKWVFNTGSILFDLEYLDLRWVAILLIVAVVATSAAVFGFRASDTRTRWCIGATVVIPLIILIAPDILFGQHRSSVARYALPAYAIIPLLIGRGIVGRPFAATLLLAAALCSASIGSHYATWWDNDINADDAPIAAAINSVPGAQIISSMEPWEFIRLARILDDDVRVSLTAQLSRGQFASTAPVFVLLPTPSALADLQRQSGCDFKPVQVAKVVTLHDVGSQFGGKAPTAPMTSILYRNHASKACHR